MDTKLQFDLGEYQERVETVLVEMARDKVIERIWQGDHTVWQDSSDEIVNRLGWLTIANQMTTEVERITDFVVDLRADDFTHAVLLGMGGSSLAPEVLSNVFGAAAGYLELLVLDSTDPGAVRKVMEICVPETTVFIVATKSGGTVETLSFFKFFYNWLADTLGEELTGDHFVAITDPGSKLVALAEKYNFRAMFENDPNIGGRYSVLSFFGLLPAALLGVDINLILQRSIAMAENNKSALLAENWGAHLGAVLGELASAGRDKLVFLTSAELANFGDWAEQLIAESTGKAGKGLLPVVGLPFSNDLAVYGEDNLFVALALPGDNAQAEQVARLVQAGYPVISIQLDDIYDLGGQFFLWEMATAVASYRLGIHPFNQPNVESAKVVAQQMVAAYQESGQLPVGEAAKFNGEALKSFLAQRKSGDYISIQAYLEPTDAVAGALKTLGSRLRDQTGLATTVGFGPRFLHSTGQLHKGDGGNGLFIQLTAVSGVDFDIPTKAGQYDTAITFGVLKAAQALGDYQALKQANPPRRVIRFHFVGDVLAQINALINMIV